MADIQITCPGCATVNTVSEFVDANNILCRDCGVKIEKPEHAGKPKQTATVRKRTVQPTVNAAHNIAESQNASNSGGASAQKIVNQASKSQPQTTVKTTQKVRKEPKKFQMSDAMWSWLLFAFLGGLTGTLRYGGILTVENIESFDAASPLIFAVVHIATCLMVAKEEVHCGIISFLMPPYMIYYLFAVSDRFYYRAIIAGLAIGMGQATLIFWAEAMSGLMTAADDWIHNPFHG